MKKAIKDGNIRRQIMKDEYVRQYYDDFLAKYSIPELNYQENDFIFRKFWGNGRVGAIMKKDGTLIFSDFANNGELNYLDFPAKVQLVNSRGYRFIPVKALEVDKEVVIGFARYNKKPVRDFVEFIVDKIVDIEICLRKNLKALQTPWLVAASSANKQKIAEFVNKLNSDEDVLFFEFEDGETSPSALVSGAPFIIDRLYNQEKAYESEILTYLGINNLGNSEKKEHLITSEIDVNNEVIAKNDDNFVTNIRGFLERINKTFGKNLTLKINGQSEIKREDPRDDEKGGR